MSDNNITVTQRNNTVLVQTVSQPNSVSVQTPGPQGPPGIGTFSTYTHNQAYPASVWTITHNLNCRPSVTIVDSAGTVVFGDVEYLSANEIRVTFVAAFAGKAYLN
jgi:hypothetical protein